MYAINPRALGNISEMVQDNDIVLDVLCTIY